MYFGGQVRIFNHELCAFDLGATSQVIGRGCAAGTSAPALSATDPVLGKSTTLSLERARPKKAGAALLGFRASARTLVDFGRGCRLYLDLNQPILLPLPVLTDAQGRWSQSLALPNDPKLRGLSLAVQALVGPSSTAPLGLDLSNAVVGVAGR